MCTTVIVGKKASATGCVIVGHTEDAAGRVMYQQFVCPGGERDPSQVLTGEPGAARIPQVDAVLTTYWSNCLDVHGSSFDQAFINEAGLVITSNGGGTSFDRTEGDPDELFSEGGIGFLLRRVVAECAKTAREAVELMGSLISTYGYRGEARNYTLADANEAWVLSVVYGRRWMAKRVPDDAVMVISNVLALRQANWQAREAVLSSPDVISYAIAKKYYRPAFDDYRDFDFARVYQSDCNRYKPTKFNRLRLGWKVLTGRDYNDPLAMPEMLSIEECAFDRISVETVQSILRQTSVETYRERGDGGADAFHHDAWDIAWLHTREAWVMEFNPYTAFNALWRTSASPEVSPFTPWFPCITEIPKSYQWTSLEEARQHLFHVPSHWLDVSRDKAFSLFSELSEIVNFNRGLLAGIRIERDGFENRFRAHFQTIKQCYEPYERQEIEGVLSQWSNRCLGEVEAHYRVMLEALTPFAMKVEPTKPSKDQTEELTVRVSFAHSPRFAENLRSETLRLSFGYETARAAVKEAEAPFDLTIDYEAREMVLRFKAQSILKHGLVGAKQCIYLRGYANFKRFVAVGEVDLEP